MQYTAVQASIMRLDSIFEHIQQKHFVICTNQSRTAYDIIFAHGGANMISPNPHLKTKCEFEIQIQNLKIPNANIKRGNSNLDSELDAKNNNQLKRFSAICINYYLLK